MQGARPLPGPVVSIPDARPPATGNEPAKPLPSIESLASMHVRLAPGMREILRGEATGEVLLPKATTDECVRVAYAAVTPVVVRLLDHDGSVLGASANGIDGALGGAGPVCFRRDALVRLEAGVDAGAVRYVVWASP